jgi:hypothetical protein
MPILVLPQPDPERELEFELDFQASLTVKEHIFIEATTENAQNTLADLIAMKKAANRPKDQEDLKVLVKLQERLAGRSAVRSPAPNDPR